MKDYLEIDSMPVSRMTNAEFYNYMTRTRRLIPLDQQDDDSDFPEVQGLDVKAAVGASAIGLSPEFVAEFDDYLAQLLEMTRESRAATETVSLGVLDAERDKGAQYLLDKVQSAMKSPVAAEREAATLLWTVLKTYSGITRETVNEETALIDGMLLDMRKPQFSATITTLGLEAGMNELESLNNQYATLVAERDDKQKEAGQRLKTVELREKLGDLFEELCDRAFAHNLVNPTEESKEFILGLNQLTKDTKGRINRRGAQDGESPTEEEPSTEEPSTEEKPSTEEPSTDEPSTEEKPEEPGGETPGGEDDDRPVVQ